MAKLDPLERWRRHVLERVRSLDTLASDELAEIQKRGLAALDREHPLSNEEWVVATRTSMESKEYADVREECRRLGGRFGLAAWTVEMLCFLKGFRPEESPLTLEEAAPKVSIVTGSDDEVFLQWIHYETERLRRDWGGLPQHPRGQSSRLRRDDSYPDGRLRTAAASSFRRRHANS